MQNIKIKIPDTVHKTLKTYAGLDKRSMQQYISLILTQIAAQGYKPAPTPTTAPEMIDFMEF